MTIQDLRTAFLDFFKEKGHAVIPSASLVPENDPTVLFTTAGMHPLVPYLMGQSHPMGKRLANCQKCLRTDDIDEVGDSRHLTFFEMLGNWSLGDYFKEEAIAWSFEFLTDVKWLGIDPLRLYVTVFAGDEDAPRDEESIGIWQAQFEVVGIAANIGNPGKDEPAQGVNGPRVYPYPKNKNWWPGPTAKGLCGPDTEIFFDSGRMHDPAHGDVCHPNCECGRFVEIWNDVFIQFHRERDGGSLVELPLKNVDTGMGLERMAAVLQGVDSVFDIQEMNLIGEAIQDVIASTAKTSLRAERCHCDPAEGGRSNLSKNFLDSIHQDTLKRSIRIIIDHIRAATFIIGDERGVVPSNVGQGYVARRLIRRAVREGRRLGITEPFLAKLAQVVIGEFGTQYRELETNRERIVNEIAYEEEKFAQTIEKGLKELDRMLKDRVISGKEAFTLFSTYGFPLELTQELIGEQGGNLDIAEFKKEFEKHQDLSRAMSSGAFKGGLADHSVESVRLHTATHLLHRALKNVLGDHVQQKGSNITAERLRFDFSNPQKLTSEEMKKVEDMVNNIIAQDLPVHCEVLTREEAKQFGAIGYFEDKYAQLGGKINVYLVGDEVRGYFSKEICGGPHVAHTGELGSFKIQKEEAVSAGVRRIKATVTGSLETKL